MRIKSWKDFNSIKESIDQDLSGEYESLRHFIETNNLQKDFVDKYKESDADLNIENWEDFVQGEMGYDEEIIKDLVGKDYKVSYDEDDDLFHIKKKKVGKVKFQIIQSDSEEIIDILDQSGIFSEFEPRFAVLVDGKIVGGSTYQLDETNTYNFDIAIIDEYQGYGISKPLIDKIIEDAKILIASEIKAQVTNNQLFDYLLQIGFKGYKDSDVKYCYLKLINLEDNYPVKEQEDYFRNFGTKRYFVEIAGKNHFFTQSSGINDVKKRIVKDLELKNLLIPENRRELTQKIANYLRDNSKN